MAPALSPVRAARQALIARCQRRPAAERVELRPLSRQAGHAAPRPAEPATPRLARTSAPLPTHVSADPLRLHCDSMRQEPSEARLWVPRSSVPRSSVPRSSVPRSKDAAPATNCAATDPPKAWPRFARLGSCRTCRRPGRQEQGDASKLVHQRRVRWLRAWAAALPTASGSVPAEDHPPRQTRWVPRLRRVAGQRRRTIRNGQRSAKRRRHSSQRWRIQPWQMEWLAARRKTAVHRCRSQSPPTSSCWSPRAACCREPCGRRIERALPGR
jgi:hypothetical protein